MNNIDVLQKLENQSTWRLCFLSAITLGIYTAHYVKRQTEVINRNIDSENQVSVALVNVFLVIAYLGILVLIPTIVYPGQYQVLVDIADVLSPVYTILIIVWAYMARDRMHKLFLSDEGQDNKVSMPWTILFNAFYINYKINILNSNLDTGVK